MRAFCEKLLVLLFIIAYGTFIGCIGGSDITSSPSIVQIHSLPKPYPMHCNRYTNFGESLPGFIGEIDPDALAKGTVVNAGESSFVVLLDSGCLGTNMLSLDINNISELSNLYIMRNSDFLFRLDRSHIEEINSIDRDLFIITLSEEMKDVEVGDEILYSVLI